MNSTLDRLQLLLETCQRWTSQIITGFHVTASELENSWSRISEEYTDQCSHLKLIPYVAISHVERTQIYPINKLRNIGLDHVMTSHVLLIDADFIPSTGLDMGVKKAIDAVKEEARYALVVPAYERLVEESPSCEDLEGCSEFMPRSMASLTKCVNEERCIVNEERCIVFHSDYFPEGHETTNSEQWLHDMNGSKVRSIPCVADRYEPYVVIPWCPTMEDTDAVEGEDSWKPKSPYYDERFYGYGLNKIQQLHHLQIPALGFLTHHPRQLSRTEAKWIREPTNEEGLKWKMILIFRQFQEELGREYRNTKVRTGICY